MKFDLDQPIRDLDGTEVKRSPDAVLTMKFAVRDALTRPPAAPIGAEESIRRYDLQVKVAADGPIDLEAKDIVLIQQCLAQFYSPLVVGQIAAALREPLAK